MPMRFLTSLSFQISAAFLVLLSLFAAAVFYALGAFERQLAYDQVVDIAGRLELSAQQLQAQAMNYEKNAPRDYPTYYRDVQLYYQDLMAHVAIFDRVVDNFMTGEFRAPMQGHLPWLQPSVNREVTESIRRLEDTWSNYRQGLFDALGPDREEPRLEFAAEHNIANHAALEQASHTLTEGLRQWAANEHDRMRNIALAVLALSAVLSLLILLILHFKVLSPLKRTISGFHRVADGNFGHRLEVTGAAETRALTESFNQLSGRLYLLFQLIGRLQQGNGLDEVIGFLSREFPRLLRIDWIGVVMVGADRTTARLESSAMNGTPERIGKQLFPLQGTLLEHALSEGSPQHIPDVRESAKRNRRYQFLASLAARGLRDAVFLPLTPQTQTPIPAVVVFATRSEGSYDDAQMRFLGNIAQLITHSFGRTVRLAEHARLAAIGELASGIAHELRTPLTTIGLAMDYFERLDLPENARKRLALARGESARMHRLLEELLLYAKPLALRAEPIETEVFLRGFIENHQSLAAPKGQKIRLAGNRCRGWMTGDADRMIQILANVTQNACEAAPNGAQIIWRRWDDDDAGTLALEAHNPGPPIPPELIERVTEPFFSTKSAGTGLGLAIVQRLVEMQGGEMSIRSEAQDGTRVLLLFPGIRVPSP